MAKKFSSGAPRPGAPAPAPASASALARAPTPPPALTADGRKGLLRAWGREVDEREVNPARQLSAGPIDRIAIKVVLAVVADAFVEHDGVVLTPKKHKAACEWAKKEMCHDGSECDYFDRIAQIVHHALRLLPSKHTLDRRVLLVRTIQTTEERETTVHELCLTDPQCCARPLSAEEALMLRDPERALIFGWWETARLLAALPPIAFGASQ